MVNEKETPPIPPLHEPSQIRERLQFVKRTTASKNLNFFVYFLPHQKNRQASRNFLRKPAKLYLRLCLKRHRATIAPQGIRNRSNEMQRFPETLHFKRL
jgi:hypothetical protein